jgi:hypothetical protein
MSFATAMERSTQFSIWLHDQCNEAEWTATDKQRGALALLQHGMDLVEGIITLLGKRLPGPALTFARPLFEGYVRGYWLSRIATDVQFDKALRGKLPSFNEILDVLGEDAESGAAWIRANKAANWTSFNDLIHGGGEHILRHVTESSIEPTYPEDEQERFLEFTLETAIRIGVEIFSLACDGERMEALHAEVVRLRR